jgi:flagellar basal body-associated protein FliL
VNLEEKEAEKSQSSRISKAVFLLMLIIVVGLAMLGVFANLQRFRRGDAEAVVVRPATSLTQSAQRR